MTKLHRRSFLARLGAGTAASVLAPFVPVLEVEADASAIQRLILMFSMNGPIYDRWVPKGGETTFELNESSQPLASIRDDVIILHGVNKEPRKSLLDGDGALSHHVRGIQCTWTSDKFTSGSIPDCGGPSDESGHNVGVSVDQHIASRLNPSTRFRSLELGVQSTRKTRMTCSRMIMSAPGTPRSPQEDPFKAYSRLFPEINQVDPEAVERARHRKASVIDYVKDSLGSLQSRVSSADRKRLEAHLTSIRTIEKRLDSITPAGSCVHPAKPQSLAWRDHSNTPAVTEIMIDLLVSALACDRTRFASLQLGAPVGPMRLPHLQRKNQTLHTLGHFDSRDGNDTREARDEIAESTTWFAQQYVTLVERLKQHGLLDSSLAIWNQELSRTDGHWLTTTPWVLAGRANGYIRRTGRFLKYASSDGLYRSHDDGVPHGQLLTSVCHAFGLTDQEHYGNPNIPGNRGPLEGLQG